MGDLIGDLIGEVKLTYNPYNHQLGLRSAVTAEQVTHKVTHKKYDPQNLHHRRS